MHVVYGYAPQVFRDLVATEGVRGLYRGALPMVLGGSLFRSAQFGVYESALAQLRGFDPAPPARLLGVLDPHIVLAGFAGGLGRGLVESPFEFVKVGFLCCLVRQRLTTLVLARFGGK